VAQPPTSGKQLISSHSGDKNQAMLHNIHFPPENISVAGPSVLPSGNNSSGQIQTLDTQQGNVGSVKKKDVEGELGRISTQTPVVHVVQRNVKERITDTVVDFF